MPTDTCRVSSSEKQSEELVIVGLHELSCHIYDSAHEQTSGGTVCTSLLSLCEMEKPITMLAMQELLKTNPESWTLDRLIQEIEADHSGGCSSMAGQMDKHTIIKEGMAENMGLGSMV